MKKINIKTCITLLIGSAIQAFGLYNVHSISGITEGGILGFTLLLQHWFNISPAISALLLNGACYVFGAFVLGRSFVALSVIAGASYSVFYALLEIFPPVYPAIAQMPLAAAIVGALFIGVGVGLCVRAGGAPGGDDALAMSIGKLSGIGIQWVYLVSDLVVLALSLSYIPLSRIVYSLLTVVLSGQIIGLVAREKKGLLEE